MPILIGTSGWQYRDWRGRFYPSDAPMTTWLTAYADRFGIVEVNNTFYRLPPADTFERWASMTDAAGLRFVIKASRYLTHVRRLAAPAEPVDRLIQCAAPLGRRLDAVLLQLPPNFGKDLGRLVATLEAFRGRQVRMAFEPRHPSWLDDDVFDLLRRYDSALCWSDRRSRVTPRVRTAGWGYIRLHAGRGRGGSYGRQALGTWADRLVAGFRPHEDVYVFFNNDHGAAAPANALTLERMLR